MERHQGYLDALRRDGVDATAVAADVTRPDQVGDALSRLGPIDVAYYGPGAADPTARPKPLREAGTAELNEAMRSFVEPATNLTRLVLPGEVECGRGTLLFVTGLGAVVPLPPLGALAVASATLRAYALTLGAGLAGTGVHAAALIIGGLIKGGDIHRHAGPAAPTLDPAEIADAAWQRLTRGRAPEATFRAAGLPATRTAPSD